MIKLIFTLIFGLIILCLIAGMLIITFKKDFGKE